MSKDPVDVARLLITAMGHDNGCKFEPCVEKLYHLSAAVLAMQGEGCEFTAKDIEEAVAGEQTEREEHFASFAGWPEVSRWLNMIFDECVVL